MRTSPVLHLSLKNVIDKPHCGWQGDWFVAFGDMSYTIYPHLFMCQIVCNYTSKTLVGSGVSEFSVMSGHMETCN